LVAAIGCLLAAEGTRSLLVDTHVYGLLPVFFGARELTAGTARTFAGTDGAPLRVLVLDTSHQETDHPLAERIAHHADGMDRILIDASTGSIKLLREVLPLLPTVFVVLAPDMASVVSLQTVQRAIEEMEEERGMEIQTFFLLNQFDPSLRLHRDVRERLTRQLGRRLFAFAVRRSNAVVEALAAGMTIVDYAPDSETVEDLRSLSKWIRELDETGLDEMQDVRWRQH
jgi:cellulose biosynthesis protein BcsQ